MDTATATVTLDTVSRRACTASANSAVVTPTSPGSGPGHRPRPGAAQAMPAKATQTRPYRCRHSSPSRDRPVLPGRSCPRSDDPPERGRQVHPALVLTAPNQSGNVDPLTQLRQGTILSHVHLLHLHPARRGSLFQLNIFDFDRVLFTNHSLTHVSNDALHDYVHAGSVPIDQSV